MSDCREVYVAAFNCAVKELLEIKDEERELAFRKYFLKRAVDALSKMPECANVKLNDPPLRP